MATQETPTGETMDRSPSAHLERMTHGARIDKKRVLLTYIYIYVHKYVHVCRKQSFVMTLISNLADF